MKPDYKKVRVIEEFETPKTKRHVRAILGVTGFFRKMIPQYSEKTFALTELTRKKCIGKRYLGRRRRTRLSTTEGRSLQRITPEISGCLLHAAAPSHVSGRAKWSITP